MLFSFTKGARANAHSNRVLSEVAWEKRSARIGATIGEPGEVLKRVFHPVKQIIGLAWRVVFGDIGVNLLEIAICVLGEQDSKAHQSRAVRLRSRLMASAGPYLLQSDGCLDREF